MIEKRHYPRLNISAPVLVKLKSGESITVDLDNISSSGLQLLCDREAESLITPLGQWDPAEMMVSVDLPGLKAGSKFEAKCVIVTSRRVAIDKFTIGLRFVDFIGESYESLGKSMESLG
jgi:hypothetical protein